MKEAVIPFVHFRDESLQSLGNLLEVKGKRLYINVLNWEEDFPYCPIAVVDVAHCTQGILLHYVVRGLSIRTLTTEDGNHVNADSCVEFFMQAEEGDAYKNFEFNAAGVCLASHRASITEKVVLSPGEFSSIRRWGTYLGQQLDIPDGIFSWELSVLIPWKTMGYSDGKAPKQMRANFYKCADKTPHPHYLSWSPIAGEPKPAFHRPKCFGVLIFEEEEICPGLCIRPQF